MKSREEDEALTMLGDFHKLVFETWRLKKGNNLEVEFSSALHVLQGFVIQHMLQREEPEEWGEWYEDT
jgi:hypothetical protein